MQPQIDRLVVAAGSQDEGSQYLVETLGVSPQEGGEHETQGTHNRVLRFGESCYLEVIAVNLDAPALRKSRWFELDSEAMRERLRSKPLLLTWALRTDRTEQLAAGSIVPLGSVTPMTRGDLRWRLTLSANGHLPGGGLIPFLIQWDGASHPASGMADVGCTLAALHGFYPGTGKIRPALQALGADELLSLEAVPTPAAARLVALIQTPAELKTLS